jgi:flagellin
MIKSVSADTALDTAVVTATDAETAATDFLADLPSAIGASSSGTAATVLTTDDADGALIKLDAIIADVGSSAGEVTAAQTAKAAVETAIADGFGSETLTNLTAGTDSGGYQLAITDATAAKNTAITDAAAYTATVSISSLSGASSAVSDVNAAIDFLSQKRSEVGAEMKRMEHTLDGLRSYEENISSTESRIRDVDVAKETSEMSKYNILQQVGTAMMAQANQLPQGVLQLIG